MLCMVTVWLERGRLYDAEDSGSNMADSSRASGGDFQLSGNDD